MKVNSFVVDDYIRQFGEITPRKGKKYLSSAVRYYISCDYDVDIGFLIQKVAQENNVGSDTVKSAISRFLKAAWGQDFFSSFWRDMTGYKGPEAPKPLEAARLLCVAFRPVYERNRGLFMRRATGHAQEGEASYYIHHKLESP